MQGLIGKAQTSRPGNLPGGNTTVGFFCILLFCTASMIAMIRQDVYFWQIRWAERWMTTHTRFSEEAIKREHPEAVRIDESHEERLVPENPMEKVFSRFRNMTSEPGSGA